jgi:hypothetical protein
VTARLTEKAHLSAKGLLKRVQEVFRGVQDPEQGKGSRNPNIPLADCLMAGLAVFGLKYPSLLQFDIHKQEKEVKHNLKSLYQVKHVPCDTYLRERLDAVDPRAIRGAFTQVFSALQRGKVLEEYEFIDGHYLLLNDGTGYFSSASVHCKNCCKKQHRDGKTTYYHMMLGAAIVHPDHKEVIPICPEPIMNEDGAKKNDCERNACKRLLADLRREHPHLPLILVEDALAANAPHLRLCQQHGIRFITVVKPEGNKTLFEWLRGVKLSESKLYDEQRRCFHHVQFSNGLPLNNADQGLEVNFIEYRQCDINGNVLYHNTWITDLEVTETNVFQIVRGGRARWKIENETFNTLKNQGYNFEHNYGHGNNNLSTVFAMLMMLAFLIDQVQQRCCGLFQAALKKAGSKKSFWEKIRAAFFMFTIDSWKSLFEGLTCGLTGNHFTPDTS